MQFPILNRLRAGETFDFETLADNESQVEEYWHWWWEQADVTKISRPETISTSEAILETTATKTHVDLISWSEFFNEQLTDALHKNRISRLVTTRAELRAQITRILRSNSAPASTSRPQIIFAGGGYGSGKTTIVSNLATANALPLGPGHMVGVDYFKLFIPEFSLIQAVADGRASATVQQECKTLASNLFEDLITERRSFIWDSSMSDFSETLSRIETAKKNDYDLSMVAVLTPLSQAIKFAMHRARQGKRFPHKDFLPQSHALFRKHLREYLRLFEDIYVFANSDGYSDIPEQIGRKQAGEKDIVFTDENRFNSLLGSADN